MKDRLTKLDTSFYWDRIQSQAAGTVRPSLSALLEVPESKHETLTEEEKIE